VPAVIEPKSSRMICALRIAHGLKARVTTAARFMLPSECLERPPGAAAGARHDNDAVPDGNIQRGALGQAHVRSHRFGNDDPHAATNFLDRDGHHAPA
jgi:hypothetical protein